MEILIFLVIWLVFGAVGAMIMSGKGRSGCGGFALGVLLGPIGLIVALLMRPSEEDEAERQLRIEDLKRGMRQPIEPSEVAFTPLDDIHIRENHTGDGEVQYRWECDLCGEMSNWEVHEQKVDRQARIHQCPRPALRR